MGLGTLCKTVVSKTVVSKHGLPPPQIAGMLFLVTIYTAFFGNQGCMILWEINMLQVLSEA